MKRDWNKVRELGLLLISKLNSRLSGVTQNGVESMPDGSESITVESTPTKDSRYYPGCVNLSFANVEGEGLLMAMKDIALSSGSACTSASLEPSYTLRALGKDDVLAHSSLRFGIGRFTTKEDINEVAKNCVKAVKKLRDMSPLEEMEKAGVDLNSIQWSA